MNLSCRACGGWAQVRLGSRAASSLLAIWKSAHLGCEMFPESPRPPVTLDQVLYELLRASGAR
ncbi:MAG TPA: hypothetical protein VKW04_24895 [Planctomycetota bacterium]|nr:hypothetical protein [Planctomycetota bacterium]